MRSRDLSVLFKRSGETPLETAKVQRLTSHLRKIYQSQPLKQGVAVGTVLESIAGSTSAQKYRHVTLAPAERNPTLRVIPNILANAVNPFITLVSATTLGRLLQNACMERGKKRVNIISSMSIMKEIASAFNKRSSFVGE